jgi:hypothetical protein
MMHAESFNLDAWIERLSRPENAKTLVDVCERFTQEVIGATQLGGAVAAIPPQLGDDPRFRALWAEFPERYYTKLPPDLSEALAREMLSHVAADAALAPALRRFAESYRDEDQAAMQILAVGAAVSMIIMVATTRFEATFGGVHVSKIAASAEQMNAAASWVSRLPGGSAEKPHEGGANRKN